MSRERDFGQAWISLWGRILGSDTPDTFLRHGVAVKGAAYNAWLERFIAQDRGIADFLTFHLDDITADAKAVKRCPECGTEKGIHAPYCRTGAAMTDTPTGNDTLPDESIVEPITHGPSSYATLIVRTEPGHAMLPYVVSVMGPDLTEPYMLQVPDEANARQGASAIREIGLRPFQRRINQEPPLPAPLTDEILYALKVAARAKTPSVVATQEEVGMQDMEPDLFVEAFVNAVRDNPEGCRKLLNSALMSTLDYTYKDDPERGLRAMLEIPTLSRAERAAGQGKLNEYLHYKNLPAKLAKELAQSHRRGFLRRGKS